jgi:hypothetical protein
MVGRQVFDNGIKMVKEIGGTYYLYEKVEDGMTRYRGILEKDECQHCQKSIVPILDVNNQGQELGVEMWIHTDNGEHQCDESKTTASPS